MSTAPMKSTPTGAMIKGGRREGAHAREKIVASVSDVFVCIADARRARAGDGRVPAADRSGADGNADGDPAAA